MAASTETPTQPPAFPSNAPPHAFAAAAEQYLTYNKPEEALQITEQGLERHPSYTGLRLFRADALLRQDRRTEAEADLRAVLEAERQHPQALKMLCRTLVDDRRWREALPLLETADFILIGDPEIGAWLKEAEVKAEEEPEPVETGPTPEEEAAAQVADLSLIPGVEALVFNASDARVTTGRPDLALALESLQGLQYEVGQVLEATGFGSLREVTMTCGEEQWYSRRSEAASIHVVSQGVRSGLVSWHCAKVLGEGTE
jgi:tetratricopeptide (TPR) repeat protein